MSISARLGKVFLSVCLLSLLVSPSRVSAGASCDGTDDFARVNSSLGISGYPFSMCVWLRDGTASEDAAALSFQDKDVTNVYFVLRRAVGGNAFLEANDGTFDSCNTGIAINDGDWHLLCLVATDSTDLEIFVDGTSGCSITSDITFGALDSFDVCRRGDSTPSRYLNGDVGSFAIWNTTLSVDEINALAKSQQMRMPLQIKPGNLIGMWEMNDLPDGQSADGLSWADFSGNGYSLVGDDGGNNTGLTAIAEDYLSY